MERLNILLHHLTVPRTNLPNVFPSSFRVASAVSAPIVKKKIVLCGGGNGCHVFCGLASANPNNEVHILSLYKDEAKQFETELKKTKDGLLTVEMKQEKKEIKSKPFNITNDPQCLNKADIIIISLPAFAHHTYLKAIKENCTPQPNKKTLIAMFPGSSGFTCEWRSIFEKETDQDFVVLSADSLPWAARIVKFGQRVEILGTKDALSYGLFNSNDSDIKSDESDVNIYVQQMQEIIGALPKLKDHGHILSISFSYTVHPTIMYGRWNPQVWDGKALAEKPLFYQGINEDTAKLMSQLSDEILKVKKNIELETGIKLNVPHIYEWFLACYANTSPDTSSLYKIIVTNPGYDGLVHPMKEVNDGYMPDFEYRYLTEDIPSGLIVTRGYALILDDSYECALPLMDKMIQWAQQVMNKEYFIYNDDGTIVAGKDINQTKAPQRYGIKSIKDVV